MIRLLLPFAAGILLQWYTSPPAGVLLGMGLAGLVTLLLFFFLPFFRRYRLSAINGIAVCVLFLCTGALLTRQKDIRNDRQWLGHLYTDSAVCLATLQEPLVEKTNSFKATASVSRILQHQGPVRTTGTVILYFSKEFSAQPPGAGSVIAFKKPLQPIRSTGNPGGFDYRRYSLFHGITHQVYLQPGDYTITGRQWNRWTAFLQSIREKVLAVLRTHISGKKELGLAEALLIGYKNDLDKSLVQSYSNTGVVHVIAISGLHLGLVYWLLLRLLHPLRRSKKLKWLPPLLTIAALWLFALLAGAQPSVLRSALMFTCIAAGEGLTRKTNIYNTLAVSAFILLCYDPFWLWDVGFQLSYAAVLSLVIFMRPVYNLLYFRNKALDLLWKLNAVTLAAQILTLPLLLYHFHQFPNYFLLTNLVAVPLSSLILIGELFLCIVAFLPAVATLTGNLLSWLIALMNGFVEYMESLPLSLWNGLQISPAQALLLYACIAGTGYWLLRQSMAGLKIGLAALLAFAGLRTISFLQAGRQQKIIVYNIPRQSAIDIIDGRRYWFTGDSMVHADEMLYNFYLAPARTLYRVAGSAAPGQPTGADRYFVHKGMHILRLDKAITFADTVPGPVIDLLILSQNPRIYLKDLAGQLTIRQVIIDGSVPAWKARYWKRDCDSLRIPCHDVSDQGAFVMNLR